MDNGKAEETDHHGVVVDEQEEEKKMEQFFALIRSFREARNRMKNELEERQEKKKMKMSNEQVQSSWVPSFELEDFTQEIEFRKPPLIFNRLGKKKEGKKKQEDGDGLDLKLSL